MDAHNPDVTLEDFVREKMAHHEKELAVLKKVLAAIEEEKRKQGAKTQEKPARGLAWAKSIDEAFERHNKLTLDQLRDVLEDMGLPAREPKSQNTIFGTVKRRVGKTLKKVGPGTYRRIHPLPPLARKGEEGESREDSALF